MTDNGPAVSIRGLPRFGSVDIDLAGCGYVRLGDGTMLQTAILTTPSTGGGVGSVDGRGVENSSESVSITTPTASTTIACLGSYDGLDWHYRGTVATLTGDPSTAAHDVAMLNWGMLYAALPGDTAAGK